MTKIRPAQFDDLTAVERIASVAYAKYVKRIGKKPAPMIADFGSQIDKGTVFVAVDDGGAICGFVVFYPRDGGIHLENVAVSPTHQGSGIGRRLIAFAEDWAAVRGYRSVDLYTNEKMVENMTFYPALGYVETRRGEEDGFRRVYYRKSIPAKPS